MQSPALRSYAYQPAEWLRLLIPEAFGSPTELMRWTSKPLGLLPPIFQPDDATHTLRDYVRQRGNLVRLSGQHIQRMQKALELMNLKLTTVLGDWAK